MYKPLCTFIMMVEGHLQQSEWPHKGLLHVYDRTMWQWVIHSSLKPKLSVLDFSPKLQDKTRNGKPGTVGYSLIRYPQPFHVQSYSPDVRSRLV